jgi:hypothetical protein
VKKYAMENDICLTIPMPLQVIVDDVGWWSGKDGSRINQPYRTGMSRDHVPEDYAALAEFGRKLHTKIMAGLVLCEWDKVNLLRKLPSSTWMGTQWSMAGHREDEKEKAAWIIRNARENIEIGLHGIGHEFWKNKKMQRAEFHNRQCEMRERDIIRKHLEYFFKLMEQYDLASRLSCFIPPAMKHSFGNGDEGFQKLLYEVGISYVATHFKKARLYSKPIHPKVTWECGVMLVDRGKHAPVWNDTNCDPVFSFDGPILPLHWPNILHHDPEKNSMVVDRWVKFIKTGAEKKGCVLSRNFRSCVTQFSYKMFSKIDKINNGYIVDLSWKKHIPLNLLEDVFFLKVEKPSEMGLKIFGAEPAIAPKGPRSLLFEMTPVNGVEKVIVVIKDSGEH